MMMMMMMLCILLQVVFSSNNEQLVAKYLRAAVKHMEKEEYSASLEACENAIELDPTLSHGYALMGNVLNIQNQWALAASSWRKATELENDNFEFYYHLGFALQQMAQDEMNNKKKWKLNTEGMEVLKKAIALGEVQNASSGHMSMTHSYLGNLYKSIAVSRISPMYFLCC